jgi:hypothetical protein
LRLGHIFIRRRGSQFREAPRALRHLATLDYAPNWG